MGIVLKTNLAIHSGEVQPRVLTSLNMVKPRHEIDITICIYTTILEPVLRQVNI